MKDIMAMANPDQVISVSGSEMNILRKELDLIVEEDARLKRIVGAAVMLVTRLDRVTLTGGAALAAFSLARMIDGLPEGMIVEAINMFKSS